MKEGDNSSGIKGVNGNSNGKGKERELEGEESSADDDEDGEAGQIKIKARARKMARLKRRPRASYELAGKFNFLLISKNKFRNSNFVFQLLIFL